MTPSPVRLRDWNWREAGPGDFADAELGGLAAIAVAMVVFLVIWPIIAIALELVVLVLICLVGIAGRVLFRRPWTVIARSQATGPPRRHEWRVVGWRRSTRLINDVIDSLKRGTDLPAGATTSGPPPRPIPPPGASSP
jgi:hypothetical protein